MAKIDKKRKRLQERIDHLQSELNSSLTKKSSNTVEINVGEQQRKILELRKELANL
jgi:sugar-specific transcriptional regulator TrmB